MSKRLTVTLVIVGVALTVYGVAQPLILYLAGIHTSGGNADTLSILVTIVAFFAAALGVGIYRLVDNRMQASAEATINARAADIDKNLIERTAAIDEALGERVKAVDELVRKTTEDVRLAVSLARGRQAYAFWIALAPFLVTEPEPDTWARSLRNEIIDAGVSSAYSAVRWVTGGQAPDPEEELFNARYSLAYFRACAYRFVDAANETLRYQALEVIPPEEQIDSLSTGKQETVAWVRMCCAVQEDPIWERGRQRAKKLYNLELTRDPSEADSMRRRYEATFYAGVLD